MPAHAELFGMRIDSIDMQEAVQKIHWWIQSGGTGLRYVVTPNVDHAILFRDHEGLRRAYEDADLVLADGHPIVWASRLLGQAVPERVPGSDLVPRVFDQAPSDRPLKVFLLGAAEGVAERAARNISRRWPNVQTVGLHSPPLGFERDRNECDFILQRIRSTHPDLLVVGLGAPKQELWVHRHHQDIAASVAICAGATIDFLAGEKQRAPNWMQRCGLEWLHRVACEPRRLVGRYARDAWVFPQLVWQQWMADRRVGQR